MSTNGYGQANNRQGVDQKIARFLLDSIKTYGSLPQAGLFCTETNHAF
jgi:hypothetical protein